MRSELLGPNAGLLCVFLCSACNVAGESPVGGAAASGDPLASLPQISASATDATETASAWMAPSLSGPPTSSAFASASSAAASASALPVDEPPPPCPPDMVLAGPTCVDPFEAYLVEITSDGEPKAHAHTDRPRKGNRYRAVSALGALPQGYISRVEAKAACEDAGKRLCTKREWQRACRGKGGARYPYGHSGKREACNTGKKHLLTELFKKPTGGLKYDEHFNSPELNATEGYLAPGGAYSGCVNEVGTYDMVGNLHEWVSDTVNDELMAALEQEDVPRRDQPWQVGNGVFMGGFYSTTSEHGPGCTFVTVAHEPTYHDYSTGFRCCKTAVLPKPEKKKTIAKPGSNKAAAPTASASASASTSTSTPPATPAAPAAQ